MRFVSLLGVCLVVMGLWGTASDGAAEQGKPVPAAKPGSQDSPGNVRNLPGRADDVKQIGDKFKGTRDLAGAAEALISGPGAQFHYSYGVQGGGPLFARMSDISSLDAFYAQRLLVCYSFVHYIAYLTSNQSVSQSGNPMVNDSDSSAYDPKTRRPVSARFGHYDIERGKLVIFESFFWNNTAGYHHIGISLGNGLIAHNSSDGNIQVSRIDDVARPYWKVYQADYPWESINRTPNPNPPPPEPGEVGGPPISGTPATPGQSAGTPSTSAPSAPAGVTPPSQPAQSPEAKQAMDAAPAGLRAADNSSCCGDPLGAMMTPPNVPTTPRYQLFVTGAPIDRVLAGTTGAKQHDGPAFAAASMLGLTSWLHGVAAMLVRQPIAEGPSVSLIATGASTGDAFEVRIDAGAGYSGRIVAPQGLVLEATTVRVPSIGTEPARDTSQLTGFCAEFQKDPPPPGTVYRVANAAQQARLKPLRKLLDAADQLSAAGKLHPDSNPASYVNFVKQYAMWTRLEGWQAESFARNFIERTKKNVEAAKQPWTAQVEAEVKKRIPGRWADIQSVLQAATQLVP